MKSFPSLLAAVVIAPCALLGDGLVRPPINYKGSLNERSQEAIIIFREGSAKQSAVEDLIIKITVEGEASNFAWIVPLPNAPTTSKSDPKLFEELHNYVQARLHPPRHAGKREKAANQARPLATPDTGSVRVISRDVVGSFDVVVVKENKEGVLNNWLVKEGFQPIVGGEKLIEEYRRRDYVFACVRVSGVIRKQGAAHAQLHPLRFTFETGGRDGIYFPMRITGLQEKPFNVNLYVFYRAWLNDSLNEYGYEQQGFTRRFRDWDSRACKANAGKAWWNPAGDPYLRSLADKLPTVSAFMKEHHHGKYFYLTNIQTRDLQPRDVLRARNDLWLFPYYTDRRVIPHDMRRGGPAAN